MIDWNRVTTLRDEVGADDFDEVISLFLEEVDEVVARLRDDPDMNNLGAELHFLKGSAAGIGFSAFTELCQTGEALCAKGRAPEVDLPALLTGYASSKLTFLEEMPKELAG
ncbi:MAG: Hpt domain-containing protein [Sulfitobacter sp.]